MRHYDDPVEVRTTERHERTEEPGQFLWHGRVWQVKEVLAHWIETGAWWQRGSPGTSGASDASDASDISPGTRDEPGDTGDLLAELEVWRVEAGRGPGTNGVFDLAFRRDDDRWRLVGCLD